MTTLGERDAVEPRHVWRPPRWIEAVGGYSWRLIVVVAAGALVLAMLLAVRAILLGLLLAILLSTLLVPVTDHRREGDTAPSPGRVPGHHGRRHPRRHRRNAARGPSHGRRRHRDVAAASGRGVRALTIPAIHPTEGDVASPGGGGR
jgi:hypothetical protein